MRNDELRQELDRRHALFDPATGEERSVTEAIEYHHEMAKDYDALSDEAERRGHSKNSEIAADAATEHRYFARTLERSGNVER